MTPEKYVKHILKLVTCGKNKKKDISRQLLSEIQERMDNQESLENIISSMGSIREIADGFNESLSAEDKKQWKKEKNLKILGIVVLVILVICFLFFMMIPKTNEISESEIFDETTVQNALMQTIDYLDAEDYNSLKQMSTDNLAAIFTKEKMDEVKAQICEGGFGNRISLGNVYMIEVAQSGKRFVTCQAQVSYENIIITYTISFDENMKLSGLYMK